MYTIFITIIIATLSFISGVYVERSNSIKKVKPIKKAIARVNRGRTIVVDRTKK